ncbi:hypothetical protein BS47DRAFT_1357194 [Hydnum rufescens UP504]|uniref:Uncharacterized protein n=1 Tax=Hydnum rufescens UP504 TaxID=1448309 RepID=A0A9P6BAV8_9AGAM|nr:hypothetical protein BS47DRAFT_1357194 [Hydnum rufescens UP504]
MHHETQECAATQDPDSRVPTTHTTTKQVRCHTPASADFLTPQNPRPKNPRARPRRNTGMRAATQDPNSRLFATNTMRRPQIRSHTPAEAAHVQPITRIKTFMVPWNLWIMVEDEDVDGFPWGPPGFFNPFLYPVAFTPAGKMTSNGTPFEVSPSG